MENIYNNYKNIIERAILVGIITEESRRFYLSAIEEENDSELCELETRVNIEESRISRNSKQNKEIFDTLQSTSSENNKSETAEARALKKGYSQLMLSESSIENYSILDIKSPKHRYGFTEESDSDVSSVKQEIIHIALPRNLKSTKCVTKLMKKPLKHHQIIDFNVPIYMSIKEERSATTSHDNHCVISDQQEMSNKNDCKNTRSKVLGTKKAQSLNKWRLSKPKVPVTKGQRSAPHTNSENFIDSRRQLDQNYSEINTNAIQKTEKSAIKKSIYTCSQPKSKSGLETNKGNPEVKENKTVCHCMNQKYPINSLLRLKVYRERLNQEQACKIKLNQPVDSDVHQHSNDVKNMEGSKMPVERNSGKCKPCNCACKSMTQPMTCAISNTETDNEDMHSVLNAPLTANNNKKERFLNLKIICQFYEDEEIMKENDIQDSKNPNGTQETQEKLKDEVFEEHRTEAKKTKRSRKMRLSKILANMKINRKQKQPDSHS